MTRIKLKSEINQSEGEEVLFPIADSHYNPGFLQGQLYIFHVSA